MKNNIFAKLMLFLALIGTGYTNLVANPKETITHINSVRDSLGNMRFLIVNRGKIGSPAFYEQLIIYLQIQRSEFSNFTFTTTGMFFFTKDFKSDNEESKLLVSEYKRILDELNKAHNTLFNENIFQDSEIQNGRYDIFNSSIIDATNENIATFEARRDLILECIQRFENRLKATLNT